MYIHLLNICNINPSIPYVFDDSTSCLEAIGNLQYKVNECISEINRVSRIVDDLDVDLSTIYQRLNSIDQEILELNNRFASFQESLLATVDRRLENLKNEVIKLLNDYKVIYKQYVDEKIALLNSRIDDIILGDIKVYNPTNGLTENVNKVINDVYEALRSGAITAQEFDDLELTVTAFELYQITAQNFDLNAKSILV